MSTCRILFVCLGNICRSPMAEFIMLDTINKLKLTSRYEVSSAATSYEEVGNDIHYKAKQCLQKHSVPTFPRHARRITKDDYQRYDLILGMEEWNVSTMLRFFGSDPDNKIKRLLDLSDNPRDIADPYYTGNFELTYSDIVEGIEALITKY